VREVLWQHHRQLYGAHEYYSTLYSEVETTAGEPDVYNMSFKGFMAWVEKSNLISKKNHHGEFETIWAVVNAVDRITASEDKLNSKASLNRQEFMQCLVRCAIAIYVTLGTIGDVSDAVGRFMLADILPNLPERALQNSNAFRKRFCYIESTSRVLERHAASLTSLYLTYADASQIHMSRIERAAAAAKPGYLNDEEQMSVGEWLTFCEHVGLVVNKPAQPPGQLSLLQAKLIFVWSRIRTAHDLSSASEVKLRHLTSVDFLEALVRLSMTLSLPTDLELDEAGAKDAGEFLLAMQASSPKAYQSFLSSHRPKHSDPDGSDYEAHGEVMPVWRRVEHTVHLIVRTVEHNMTVTAASDAKEAGVDGLLEVSETAKFLKRRSQGAELSRYEASLGDVNFGEALENAANKSMLTIAALKIQMMCRLRKAKRRINERKAEKLIAEAKQLVEAEQQLEYAHVYAGGAEP